MHSELPVCKRCCFCMPLRYGLIVWGYFKVAICSLLLTGISISLYYMIRAYGSEETRYRVYIPQIVLCAIVFVIMIADITLSITFIVGCHMKHVKIMKTYYYYSMFLFGFTSILFVYAIGMTIYYLAVVRYYNATIATYFFEIVDMAIFVANLAIQFYLILLVRSEIVKLESGCQFRFVNNAAEAECTLEVHDSKTEKRIENNKTGVDSDDDIKIYV